MITLKWLNEKGKSVNYIWLIDHVGGGGGGGERTLETESSKEEVPAKILSISTIVTVSAETIWTFMKNLEQAVWGGSCLPINSIYLHSNNRLSFTSFTSLFINIRNLRINNCPINHFQIHQHLPVTVFFVYFVSFFPNNLSFITVCFIGQCQ